MRGEGKKKESFQEQRKKVNILGVMNENKKWGIMKKSVLMKGERGKKGRKREKEARKEGRKNGERDKGKKGRKK